MNFFKKIFKSHPPQSVELKPENLSNKVLDDLFVEKFIAKGGKFLYCQTTQEIRENLLNILEQEQWQKIFTFGGKLGKLLQSISVNPIKDIEESDCFITNCEYLIAEDGSILFSSKQLKENRLNTLPENFIVYAKTSQFVHNKDESLTGIKNRYYKKIIPSNIAAIKSYNPQEKSDDFMTYGNNNAKQLYLLLLEDL